MLFSKKYINLVKLYSRNNVFFKYFRKSVVCILIPLVILSSLVCFYMFRLHEEDVESERSRALYRTSSSLEAIFADVENNHLVLSNSGDVHAYCALENVISGSEYPLMYATSKLIDNIRISSQYITNVHLYSPRKDFVLSTQSSAPTDSFFVQSWYKLYKDTGRSDFVYYNRSLSPNIYEDSVIVARGLWNEGVMEGIVLYNVDIQAVKAAMDLSARKASVQVLCDTDGNVFYSSDFSLVGKSIENIHHEYGELFYKSNKSSLYFETDISGLYTYVYTERANSLSKYLTIAGILIGIGIVVLILSFFLSVFLSVQFYESIIQLTSALGVGDEKSGDAPNSNESYNELYYINSLIVPRLSKGENIEKHLAEHMTALKKAQFVALQTQLNPHFIHNTLNLINMMVMNMVKKDCDASRAIVILSQLIREALDTQRYLVTLRDELSYVNKYIELQKLKFCCDIDVVTDIDDSLLNYNVLKFMLQPIVENAFAHGFHNNIDETARLEIKARKQENKLIVSVSNNGKTIEKEELSKLQEMLKSDTIFEQKRIGLVNVNHRIRIIFGHDYGLNIKSQNNLTTVEIVLNIENQQNS